ncbi:MAG: ribonuclease P protein component [Acidobacteriota bacterium]
MKLQGLPAAQRLRKRRDFERAYAEGHKVVIREFALYAYPNRSANSRLGVTATRRLGKAVIRNRARRLIREAYRKNRYRLPPGYDYVVVARRPLLLLKSTEVEPLLVNAAARATGPAK